MRIRRVKYDGRKVTIEYQKRQLNGEEYDDFTMVSSDEPIKSFKTALESLSGDVVKICEFAGGDVDVRGVSFSWTKDIMGCVITALKTVEASNSPLVVNTPHATEKAYSDNAEGVSSTKMNPSLVKRLKAVLVEAERFIDGTRAQKKQERLI